VIGTGVLLTRVANLSSPAMAGFHGMFRFGEMVLPWLGLGLSVGGGGGVGSNDAGARNRVGQGQLLLDVSFVPVPKRVPLTLRTSFGFGGGAQRQDGIDKRAGFGGAVFGAAARYEWFPGAARRRPTRGGGFGIGPEIGWIGFPPAAAGRPMSNMVYVAIATTFYFGS
jgi:hypothetical protein